MKRHIYTFLLPLLMLLAACTPGSETSIEAFDIKATIPFDHTLEKEDGNKYSGSEEDDIYVVKNAQGDKLVELYEITEDFKEDSIESILAKNPTLEGATSANKNAESKLTLTQESTNGCGGYVAHFDSEAEFTVYGLCETKGRTFFCTTYPEVSNYYIDEIIDICESIKPV